MHMAIADPPPGESVPSQYCDEIGSGDAKVKLAHDPDTGDYYMTLDVRPNMGSTLTVYSCRTGAGAIRGSRDSDSIHAGVEPDL